MEVHSCKCCCDDINDDNRCLYSTDVEPDNWNESLYCIECVRFLISIRFNNYLKAIENSDCAKELAGLLKSGPPVWLEDGGLPVPKEQHVRWFKGIDGEKKSAHYDGALFDEERQELWRVIVLAVQPCIDAQQLDQARQIADAKKK